MRVGCNIKLINKLSNHYTNMYSEYTQVIDHKLIDTSFKKSLLIVSNRN